MTPEDRLKVSVVTIAWRNEGFAHGFAKSLAHAADRASGLNLELVVVTNGPDGQLPTQALLDACRATSLSPVVVPLDGNTGFSGGANAGVARGGGEVVVVANLDLTFDEQFLDILRGEAVGHDWDLLAPRVVQGEAGQETGVSRRRRSHRLAWVVPPPATPASIPAGNGSCIILRRSTLQQREAAFGALFDPEYRSFNEDIDLFWWAERAGLVVRYVPDLRVDHALAGSFGGAHRFTARPLPIQRQVMANYRVTVWKNARGILDWLGWPLGEAQYLGQALVSRKLAGLRAYAGSWSEAFATVRAIRLRRGRLRPLPSRSR
jgi:hypothetical protein